MSVQAQIYDNSCVVDYLERLFVSRSVGYITSHKLDGTCLFMWIMSGMLRYFVLVFQFDGACFIFALHFFIFFKYPF